MQPILCKEVNDRTNEDDIKEPEICKSSLVVELKTPAANDTVVQSPPLNVEIGETVINGEIKDIDDKRNERNEQHMKDVSEEKLAKAASEERTFDNEMKEISNDSNLASLDVIDNSENETIIAPEISDVVDELVEKESENESLENNDSEKPTIIAVDDLAEALTNTKVSFL